MRSAVTALFILLLISITSTVFPVSYSLVETQPYDPSLLGRLGMERYTGQLLDWKDGYILEKDPFEKNASWNKWKKVRLEDFRIRITGGRPAGPVKMPDAENFSFSRDGNTAVFTAAFEASPVSTAAVFDFKQGRVIYSIGLKRKGPGSKGPPQLPMENAWFIPVISGDGSFFVCDGFKGTGEREAAVVNMNEKQLTGLENCFFPGISGRNVFFLRRDPKTKTTGLVIRRLDSRTEQILQNIGDTAMGLEIMDKCGYLITRDRVFSFEAVSGGNFQEIYNFNEDRRLFKIWEIARTYSGYYKGVGYLFFVIKKMEKDNYEWELYAMKVE